MRACAWWALAPAPSRSRLGRGRRGLGTALILWGLFAVAASPACAESSWWHLSSGSRPSYLHPGIAKPGVMGEDEVQEIDATLVEFNGHPTTGFVLIVAGRELGQFVSEPLAAELGPEFTALTAANVQAALEEAYGKGAVHVTEDIGAGSLSLRVSSQAGSEPIELGPEGFEPSPEVKVTNPGRVAVPPTGDGEIYVTAENVGNTNAEGGKAPVQLKDVLPSGLRAVGIAATQPHKEGDFHHREPLVCDLETLTCTLAETLVPYDQVELRISVEVLPGARTGELNEVSVSGGGALPSSARQPITISAAPVPFGIESYEMALEEEGGIPATQAGAHPFQLNMAIALNQLADINPLLTPPEFRPEVASAGLAKDLSLRLPPGLIGNPTPIPRCTIAQFYETGESENRCPPDTAVGVAVTTVHEPVNLGTVTLPEPVFNLEPSPGEPARFGFYVVDGGSPVLIDTSLRAGRDYGVTVNVENITQSAGLLSSDVTLWGVPGDPRHDGQRGWGCLYKARGAQSSQACAPSSLQRPPAFLSLPTSCGSAMQTSASGDSWSEPGNPVELTGRFSPATLLRGCNRLQFAPEMSVALDSQQGSVPSGLTIALHIPQEAGETAAGLVSSAPKTIEVTLPPGVALNPSAADGLQSCPEALVGLLPGRGEQEELLFTPGLPEAFCPDAAKIGTVTIGSSLLPPGQKLEGGLYLATPAPGGEAGRNPFDSLLAMYIVARDPVSGALVKLPGRASLDPGTGQIGVRFQELPQLAFEDVEVHLFGGDRAPLATPAHCGTYTAQTTLTAWAGAAPAGSSSDVRIASGPNGAPCPSPLLPFAPSLRAGTTSDDAGSISPLTAAISREAGNGEIGALALRLPPGLSGVLGGVGLCPLAQADAGACGAGSLIGHAAASVGLGPAPLVIGGGRVYLTEGRGGAPFGISIVLAAVAGPFDLGTVVVEGRIEVDARTAALTVRTDESGPHAIPRILDGIPLQIRRIEISIDRPGFILDPTSCAPQAIAGTFASAEGAGALASAPFQMTNCAALRFAPRLEVSASARSSRLNGTSLRMKLTMPGTLGGGYANISRLKVRLPKQLAARLTTLQHACRARVFEQGPAGCPPESVVGRAKVVTPLLPVALTGHAYFVSHGSEAFPDLAIALEGYGIAVRLVGSTQIAGSVTTTTFTNMPDAPFSSLELSLPPGRYSAVAANADLCKAHPVMAAEFTAQNGARLGKNVRVSVTGCPRHGARTKRLEKALKTCRRQKQGAPRRACEARARKRLGRAKPPHAKR